MKKIIKRGSRLYRLFTGLMPDFIIIGAQRCGTTSLYKYLIKHPCVASASTKEVHFFDINFGKGINWYRAHFPSFLYKYFIKKIRRQNLITGEATPYYIFHPHAPKRILEEIPRVKLIVLLRNPIDRAISHYYHEKRLEVEKLSFEEAIKKEKERIKNEEEKMLKDENYYSFNHQHYSYLSRGAYVDQLKVWMDLFPRKQILIIKSEDFYNNPSIIFKRVLKFLDLPNWGSEEYKKYGEANYADINPSTRESLIKYFKPHNQRLHKYLGVDFNWDK